MKISEYPALTVETLYTLCKTEIERGNKNKKILISSDDVGNEYHGLFHGFTSDENNIKIFKKYGCFHDNVDAEGIIILG